MLSKFSVIRPLILSLAALAALAAGGRAVLADISEQFTSPAVNARLITAQDGIAPGAVTLSAGLDLELGEGWKTYWRSPGEVGLPPEVDWAGSENIADVQFLWPAPTRFTAFGIENFGYAKEVVFPLQIELERPGEPVNLAAKVNLLVCSQVCVPQDFDLSLALPAGTGIDQGSADRISTYLARVPVGDEAAGLEAATAYLDDQFTALTLEFRSPVPFEAPDAFPELGSGTALGKPDIRLGASGRTLWAQFPVLSADEEALQNPVLAVTVTDGPGRAFTVSPALADAPPAPPFSIATLAPGIDQLAWIALVALFGGLILNVMPCVLPVLSIKLSSALKQQGRDQMAVRGGFLAAAAGVMVFMWALAAILFVLQRVGLAVGWGLQFQNPVFLALMFIVLAVFAANLFGAFEISLPATLQTRMAAAGPRRGYGADFLTGMFGAVMATPCSAPFLGTAIAFALAGRGVDILIVFTSLGIGLALPYLIVAAAPRLVAFLPRPGRWMAGLKLVLGLLLVGTAIWLLWVLTGVAGPVSAAAVAGFAAALVMTLAWNASAAWLRWSGVFAFSALPLIAAPVLSQSQAQTDLQAEAINWVVFDRGDIARRVSRGEVVFVDVTADWCLTCKANKALVLEREPVLSALNSAEVVAMQADWTRPDEAISRYLESFNRYGIPFNAVYGPGAPDGIVLSELLSTSAVMEALEDARARSALSERIGLN